MLFWMKFNVEFEVCAEFLEHILCQIGGEYDFIIAVASI